MIGSNPRMLEIKISTASPGRSRSISPPQETQTQVPFTLRLYVALSADHHYAEGCATLFVAMLNTIAIREVF